MSSGFRGSDARDGDQGFWRYRQRTRKDQVENQRGFEDGYGCEFDDAHSGWQSGIGEHGEKADAGSCLFYDRCTMSMRRRKCLN